jgi:hypothetical protein
MADFSSVGMTRCKRLADGERYAHVLSVGTVVLKFTLKKTVLLKNVQHVMAINLCSSLINVYCQSMRHLLETAMTVKSCFAYLCMMCVISLRTMLFRTTRIFGTHDFVTSILVVSRG